VNDLGFLTLIGYIFLATTLILIAAYLSNTGRLPAWIRDVVIVILPCGLVIPIGKMVGITIPGAIIIVALFSLIVSIVVVRSRKSSGSTESNQSGNLK